MILKFKIFLKILRLINIFLVHKKISSLNRLENMFVSYENMFNKIEL